MTNFITEACVESLDEALKAEALGADRVELCANLALDGITPERDVIKQAKDLLSIPIRVMIRPRGGDFIYSEAEFKMMKQNIEFCKSVGVEGVVFGILNEDKTLDLDRIAVLVEIAKPLKVVIHKAIDETPDILKATEDIVKINGINTILTSGGKTTAEEGISTLKRMIAIAGNQLEIMPAGSITKENLDQMHKSVDAWAYHGRQILGVF
ncbi:copper homeostasis protein CutC [Zunongwangia endophytica]|uniref:PF03932 family protein CutC n=1 Tax=Zunongwangia endophytica TaxID=1808945 RepID=A0ABV8H5C4_9FLAO|nr:copper homeostasis protein CutC [Zunongwangia endophytica]MDN3595415.1 copper homeostasis protein CutC [Zunongwangia endophytica]